MRSWGNATRHMARGFYWGVAALSLLSPLTRALAEMTPRSGSEPAHTRQRVDFVGEEASADALYLARWAVDSGDHLGLPFAIVDKVAAKVFVFAADGRLRDAAPVLLGLARGDTSVAGIGERKLSTIRPDERTTPAGRFVAALDLNSRGEEVLWVDYEGAVSLHRVRTGNVKEHRGLRLASLTPLDNRISFGCINVPVKFYEDVVHPAFLGTNGIVYVLPEIRSVQAVFGSYDVVEIPQDAPAAALPSIVPPTIGQPR